MKWRDQREMVRRAILDMGSNRRVNCPLCTLTGKPDRRASLQVYDGEKGASFHCFKCGAGGSLGEGALVSTGQKIQPLTDQALNAKRPPPGFFYLTEEPALGASIADHARTYLKTPPPIGRGLTDERLWKKAKIGATLLGWLAGKVVLPILAEDQETWLGWVGRYWQKEPPEGRQAYYYPPGNWRQGVLYNAGALWRETSDPLFVVEGGFDVLWMGLDDSTGTLGNLSQLHMRALRMTKRPVVFCKDGDDWETGERAAQALRLRGQEAGNLRLAPRKDPDDYSPWTLQDYGLASLKSKRVTLSVPL